MEKARCLPRIVAAVEQMEMFKIASKIHLVIVKENQQENCSHQDGINLKYIFEY